MKLTIWGARGSLPAPSPDNQEFGGNTSCVELSDKETLIILDAGSGIRQLGDRIARDTKRIDLLLTHLHLDHIMGLGFFAPLYNPAVTVHIWGPASNKGSLQERLTRYLSPPLFPIRLQDLPCQLQFHELSESSFEIGGLQLFSTYVCHPGPTLAYRIENSNTSFAYIPDHEPELGASNFPYEAAWTSGYDIAKGVNLLFHDAQYTKEEYLPRIGWGHSTFMAALEFANLAKVQQLVLFHHDPFHTDEQLKTSLAEVKKSLNYPFEVSLAKEGESFLLRD